MPATGTSATPPSNTSGRPTPTVFLVAETEGLAPGRALDLPCGEGRNAVWLAEQGWDATGRALAPNGTLLVVAHDSANLTGGVGGPQDPAVLYTTDDVLADLAEAGIDVTVERAETVERSVATADRPALDCLVRARR